MPATTVTEPSSGPGRTGNAPPLRRDDEVDVVARSTRVPTPESSLTWIAKGAHRAGRRRGGVAGSGSRCGDLLPGYERGPGGLAERLRGGAEGVGGARVRRERRDRETSPRYVGPRGMSTAATTWSAVMGGAGPATGPGPVPPWNIRTMKTKAARKMPSSRTSRLVRLTECPPRCVSCDRWHHSSIGDAAATIRMG